MRDDAKVRVESRAVFQIGTVGLSWEGRGGGGAELVKAARRLGVLREAASEGIWENEGNVLLGCGGAGEKVAAGFGRGRGGRVGAVRRGDRAGRC